MINAEEARQKTILNGKCSSGKPSADGVYY